MLIYHLEALFCDPQVDNVDQDDQDDLPASSLDTANSAQQALDDKLIANPAPPANSPQTKDVMVVDEETVAHLTQCMVCFGAEADVELINCGDQMCFACLEQYLEYSLRSLSFGIQPVVIECPLCKCPMEAEDWEPYVDDHIIILYDECLTKKRSLERPCTECGNVQGFLTPGFLISPLLCIDEKSALMVQSRLELGAPSAAYAVWCEAASSMAVDDENVITGNQQLLCAINSISAQSFYKAQLAALDKFPNVKCEQCGHLFCLKCTNGAHPESCISKLQFEIGEQRPCPRCFCQIEREAEGCNEMECEVCGKRFCWECLQPWSRSCGIYECSHPLTLARSQMNTSSGKGNRQELAWELHDKIRKR